MTAAGHVYAAGASGTVLASPDGGQTWLLRPTGDLMSLESLDFVDAAHGFAVGSRDGRGEVRRKGDGGLTWQTQLPAAQTYLREIDFHDRWAVVIVGWFGVVFWTFDGGTWLPRATGTDVRFDAVHVFDDSTAVVGGYAGTILRTTDDSATWTPCPDVGNLYVLAFAFANDRQGVAVGRTGAAWTADGGRTWTPGLVPGSPWLEEIACRGDTALAVAHDGLFRSVGGATWAAFTGPADESWSAVAFHPDGGTLLSGGWGSLWQTDAAATTWVNRQSRLCAWVHDIAGLDGATAVAVGRDRVLRTTNGGLVWHVVAELDSVELETVDFADAVHGLALTGDGNAWRTRDGGTTWQPVPTGLPAFDIVQDLWFADATSGWLCTWYGRILRTTDGGVSWQEAYTSNLDLTAVHFADPPHGICVGGVAGQGVFRSGDAGLTWQRENACNTLPVRDICLLAGGIDLLVVNGGIVRSERLAAGVGAPPGGGHGSARGLAQSRQSPDHARRHGRRRRAAPT